MCLSYQVDRFNLLRVFKPPPRTTDRTVTMSVLYILPAAVFGHVWMAIFFYSKQVGLEVPMVYYLALFVLAFFVMFRISRELRRQTRGELKEDAMEMTEMGTELSNENENSTDSELLSRSDVELYVPPLTTTLLDSIYMERAANRVLTPCDAQVRTHPLAVLEHGQGGELVGEGATGNENTGAPDDQ